MVQLGRHPALRRRQVLSIYELEGLENGRFIGHTFWEAEPEAAEAATTERANELLRVGLGQLPEDTGVEVASAAEMQRGLADGRMGPAAAASGASRSVGFEDDTRGE